MAFTNCKLRFNEKLIWLMDCEFYTRLILKFGFPRYISDSVLIREHPDRLTHKIGGGTVLVEREICNNLYKHLKKKRQNLELN